MADTLTKVGFVVLAGGDANRMEGDKANRLLGGKSLLAHVVTRLQTQSGFDREKPSIALAVRHKRETIPAPFLAALAVIYDPAPDLGPMGGLMAGLEWAEQEDFAYLQTAPCDTPFLPSALTQHLRAALDANPVALCAVPTSQAQDHPACALWRVQAKPAAQAYLDTKRRALIGFAETIGCVRVPFSTPAQGPDAFFNINTPGDLALAEAWF